MSRATTLVLRPLPRRSYLHDLWAGTKLLAVAAISVVLTIDPSWPVVGLFAALLVIAAAAATFAGWLAFGPSPALGLALVAAVARLHGAAFTLSDNPDSTPGPGLRAELRFE